MNFSLDARSGLDPTKANYNTVHSTNNWSAGRICKIVNKTKVEGPLSSKALFLMKFLVTPLSQAKTFKV